MAPGVVVKKKFQGLVLPNIIEKREPYLEDFKLISRNICKRCKNKKVIQEASDRIMYRLLKMTREGDR